MIKVYQNQQQRLEQLLVAVPAVNLTKTRSSFLELQSRPRSVI